MQPSSGGWWSVTTGLSSLRIGVSPARLGHFLTAWGHFPSQPFLTLLKIHMFSLFQSSRQPLSVTLHALDTYLLPRSRPRLSESSPPGSDSSQGFYPTGRQCFHLRSHFRWKRFLRGRTQNQGGIQAWRTGFGQSCSRQSYRCLCFLSLFHPRMAFSNQSTLVCHHSQFPCQHTDSSVSSTLSFFFSTDPHQHADYFMDLRANR